MASPALLGPGSWPAGAPPPPLTPRAHRPSPPRPRSPPQGNIWTHLVGFLIFLGLTAATFYLKPQPLRLGADALLRLEERLYAVGKSNLFELLQTVEAWEDKASSYQRSGA